MTLSNAEAVIFEDQQQSSNWLCYNQYQGTDMWDEEFPIYANPTQKTSKGFSLDDGLKVMERVSPHGYAEILKARLMFFRFSMIDAKAGICDASDNWNQLMHNFTPPISNDTNRPLPYCKLCQYNAGRMVIAKTDGEWVYRGGHIVPCMHDLQGYSPLEEPYEQNAKF